MVQIDVDDAIQYIVKYVRAGRKSRYGTYGYTFYLLFIARDYLEDLGIPEHSVDAELRRREPEISRAFFAAAWELCRRGILRPGLQTFSGQGTADGASGNGYAVTPYGERWIREADELDLVPMQPGRFASLLAGAGTRFGSGFVERCEQAVGSYNAHAFLACCAMCGAAAESVILALAIVKNGDGPKVLSLYATASGRGRVETLILGQQPEPVRQEFHRYTALLKYWRDASAHGRAVNISEPEAYQSLALLLRFALFAESRWSELTGR